MQHHPYLDKDTKLTRKKTISTSENVEVETAARALHQITAVSTHHIADLTDATRVLHTGLLDTALAVPVTDGRVPLEGLRAEVAGDFGGRSGFGGAVVGRGGDAVAVAAVLASHCDIYWWSR